MTGMDFSGAPTQQFGNDGELIPNGTLAWATVHVRPHNIDQALVVVPSKKNEANGFLDLELTIEDGQHARRKVWDRVGVRGNEQWIAAGMAAIRHMLEAGRGAGPNNRQAYVLGAQYPQGSELGFMELDGLRVAIRVGIEKGKDGYDDKNKIARYLSPNPDSDTAKDFQRLIAGDTAPKEKAAAGAGVAAQQAMPWSKPAAPPPAQPTAAQPPVAPQSTISSGFQGTVQPAAPAPTGKPSWLPPRTA